MARRSRDGSESVWQTAPDFLTFVNKDAPTLCKQIRAILHNSKDFLGHIKDDNGGNNFADTAFNGDRGLDRTQYPESEVPTEKPHITHAALLKLGHDWVDSTGGEFKGDEACGCEPAHYAIRYSGSNKIDWQVSITAASWHPWTSRLPSMTMARIPAMGRGLRCRGYGRRVLRAIHHQGKVPRLRKRHRDFEEQALHLELEYPAPMIFDFSGECADEPDGGHLSLHKDIPVINAKSVFDMKGAVGEVIDRVDDAMPAPLQKCIWRLLRRNDSELC